MPNCFIIFCHFIISFSVHNQCTVEALFRFSRCECLFQIEIVDPLRTEALSNIDFTIRCPQVMIAVIP